MTGFTAESVVLVTGASGFIGRHCCERLAREPGKHHAVRYGASDNVGPTVWHSADLLDSEAVRQLIAKIRPTHLLHAAWIATPGIFWNAPENLDWLQAGLELARAFGEAGGRSFLGVGSCAEYDWRAARFAEDETPIRPTTLYGRAKAAMWASLEACAAHYGFSAAWGRVFLPYGPGDAAQRLVPTVVERLRAGQPVCLTEGLQERDFIYAPDVADLLVRLLGARAEGAFNIATGRGASVRYVVEYLADRIGGRSGLRFGARSSPVAEPPRIVGETAKVAALLGWQAPTTLEAGLNRILALSGGNAAAAAAG